MQPRGPLPQSEEVSVCDFGRPTGTDGSPKRIDPDSAAGAAPNEEAAPDSLEQDSVKKHRPAYKSDAGRTVYGGGGVTPDVIVPEDTASTAEQEFAKAIAPKFPAYRGVLYSYAFELKDDVAKNFTVTPQWRDELYKRLVAAKVLTDRKQYDVATPLVDRSLSQQVARLAFVSEFAGQARADGTVTRAIASAGLRGVAVA